MSKSIRSRPDTPLIEGSEGLLADAGGWPRVTPFFSFRYSYRELSCRDGKMRVKAKECRFEEGKLTTEEFEGTTSPEAYTEAVIALHRLAQEQAAFLLRPLSWFLSASNGKKPK